jgi:bla regulator protein BlaR1
MIMMRTALFSLAVGSLCLQCQTPGVPAIEVATIRPATWTSQAIFEKVSASTKGCLPVAPQIRGNRIIWNLMSVCGLVSRAYEIESYQMVGGPKWIRTSTDPTVYFDIQVQVAEGTVVTREQSNLILRALLADRFHLTMHQETRELPVYEMKVDKGGLKVLSTDLPTCDRNRPGRFLQNCKSTSTMAGLAKTFSSYVDRPVVDRTGFSDKFAYLVMWSSSDAGQGLDSAPELFTVLRDQLGIKLEAGKANVPVLVIDTVERPTEN